MSDANSQRTKSDADLIFEDGLDEGIKRERQRCARIVRSWLEDPGRGLLLTDIEDGIAEAAAPVGVPDPIEVGGHPEPGGGWRYQPVVVTNGEGDVGVTLCEVYFDDNGRLKAWTEDPAMAPGGENVEELSRDLCRMLADAYKWKPVPFTSLRAGMTFEGTGVDVERMITALDAARRLQ